MVISGSRYILGKADASWDVTSLTVRRIFGKNADHIPGCVMSIVNQWNILIIISLIAEAFRNERIQKFKDPYHSCQPTTHVHTA